MRFWSMWRRASRKRGLARMAASLEIALQKQGTGHLSVWEIDDDWVIGFVFHLALWHSDRGVSTRVGTDNRERHWTRYWKRAQPRRRYCSGEHSFLTGSVGLTATLGRGRPRELNGR